MMDDDKTGPVAAAMMSLNMLIEAEGRNYTWAEYSEWLEEAGFKGIERVHVYSPGMCRARTAPLRAARPSGSQ
jgi:hypothetical protein